MTEVKNCRIQPKKNIYKPLFGPIPPNFQDIKTTRTRHSARASKILQAKNILQTPAFNTYIKLSLHS